MAQLRFGGGFLRDGEAGVLTHSCQQEQRDGGEDAEKSGQSDSGSAPLPPVQIFLRQLPAHPPQGARIGRRFVGEDGLRRWGGAAGLLRALQLVLQQIVGADAEEAAHLQQLLYLRHRLGTLPLGDGLAGDVEPVGQLLLRPAGLSPQIDDFIGKGHGKNLLM